MFAYSTDHFYLPEWEKDEEIDGEMFTRRTETRSEQI